MIVRNGVPVPPAPPRPQGFCISRLVSTRMGWQVSELKSKSKPSFPLAKPASAGRLNSTLKP